MSPAVELPAEIRTVLSAHAGLLHHADATRVGATRAELTALVRHGALERVARGVYAEPAGGAPTWSATYLRQVRAVLARKRDGAVIVAGPAAVVLHGLPLLGPPPAVVHVSGLQRGGPGVGPRLHPIGLLSPDEVVTSGPWRLAAPARAALDTARLMGVASGVAAADAALRQGLATAGDLALTCARLARTARVARARRALALADPRSESPGESWSAVVIDDLGLPRPERQQEHHDGRGLIGRSDFWWPAAGVVGEFDGRVKYGRDNPSGRPPEQVLWAEKRREDRLRAAGLVVVRWTVAELAQPHLLHRLLAPHLPT